MLTDCPFLEQPTGAGGEVVSRSREFHCAAGVNFYSLGEGRKLCRTCPLFGYRERPFCRHLEVYAFLNAGACGEQSIRVELECNLLDQALDDLGQCASCPSYRT